MPVRKSLGLGFSLEGLFVRFGEFYYSLDIDAAQGIANEDDRSF